MFRAIAEYCSTIGIPYLTVYAFSTENWKRPQNEINAIMNLLRQYLDDAFDDKSVQGRFRTRFIGDRKALAPDIAEKMARAEELTKDCEGTCVCIALNYGGRAEIVEAAKDAAQKAVNGEITPESITEEFFSSLLYTSGIPDPDVIIRPSGERRSSNFLVWQSAYAEFVFEDVLWPDFKPEHLDKALLEYSQRVRRFGGAE